jgi:hypothetical protein
MKANARALAGLAVLVLAMAACSPSDDRSDANPGDPAVWYTDPQQDLRPESTTVTALVSRMACNNGVTGEVLAPKIDMGPSEIVITFQVAPKQPGEATCPSNAGVPYEVDLGEPIGQRTLVDGECLGDDGAKTTAFCQPNATRFSP